jgi:catechol 2,3-dioxygenase-like lactoylglutathione lyase family enzyme
VRATDVFAGVPVGDHARAVAWWTRLLGAPPTFQAHPAESVWQLAEHRYLYVEERPGHEGHAELTVFVDDLDAVVAAVAARGIEPVEEERHGGVRKVTYRDPDGNEFGLGGAPAG